jgi:hypothetical protein
MPGRSSEKPEAKEKSTEASKAKVNEQKPLWGEFYTKGGEGDIAMLLKHPIKSEGDDDLCRQLCEPKSIWVHSALGSVKEDHVANPEKVNRMYYEETSEVDNTGKFNVRQGKH